MEILVIIRMIETINNEHDSCQICFYVLVSLSWYPTLTTSVDVQILRRQKHLQNFIRIRMLLKMKCHQRGSEQSLMYHRKKLLMKMEVKQPLVMTVWYRSLPTLSVGSIPNAERFVISIASLRTKSVLSLSLLSCEMAKLLAIIWNREEFTLKNNVCSTRKYVN